MESNVTLAEDRNSTAMDKHKRAQSHATHRFVHLCTDKYAKKRMFQTGKLIPFFRITKRIDVTWIHFLTFNWLIWWHICQLPAGKYNCIKQRTSRFSHLLFTYKINIDRRMSYKEIQRRRFEEISLYLIRLCIRHRAALYSAGAGITCSSKNALLACVIV